MFNLVVKVFKFSSILIQEQDVDEEDIDKTEDETDDTEVFYNENNSSWTKLHSKFRINSILLNLGRRRGSSSGDTDKSGQNWQEGDNSWSSKSLRPPDLGDIEQGAWMSNKSGPVSAR